MTFESPYGKRLGLRDRINDWIKQLGTDKSLPWVGLGLIADLRLVAEVLPNKIEEGKEFDMNEPKAVKPKTVEFDL